MDGAGRWNRRAVNRIRPVRHYSDEADAPPSVGLLPWTLHPWLATVEKRISPAAASAKIARPMRLLVKAGVKMGPGIRILAVLSRSNVARVPGYMRLCPDLRHIAGDPEHCCSFRKQYIASPD